MLTSWAISPSRLRQRPLAANDETIGIYCARLTGQPEHLVMLNNKRPLTLESTLRAGYRLVLHGLSTEMLHGLLLQPKAQQAAQLAQEEGAA